MLNATIYHAFAADVRIQSRVLGAFPSEEDIDWRKDNAENKKPELCSDSVGTRL